MILTTTIIGALRTAVYSSFMVTYTAALFVSPDAAISPIGIWLDHTGRGAVEISECGGNLCGKVVWIKDNQAGKACGVQVIGNVKAVSRGAWDKGWIYDPEYDERYDVAITPLATGKLEVMGYMGVKSLSETMVWTKAPDDISRCTT